jgi:hypothetical protein
MVDCDGSCCRDWSHCMADEIKLSLADRDGKATMPYAQRWETFAPSEARRGKMRFHEQ